MPHLLLRPHACLPRPPTHPHTPYRSPTASASGPGPFRLLFIYRLKLLFCLSISPAPSTRHPYLQITDHLYIGGWPSEEALVPTVHPAVLDVTCELPLQLTPPAYKALPVW